jgi:hypothetical protein
MKKQTEIDKAQQVLADLNAQREELIARGHDLEERRQEISFSAHTGSKKDRAQLDQINSEAITHEYELKSLDSAIQEATKRLAAADAAEALAQEFENARALRAVVDKFVVHAIALDAAFSAVTKEAMALEDTLKSIHALGCSFPSRQQLDSLGARAMKAALMATPWKREFETMPPGARQSFAALVSQWGDRIEQQHIAPKLGAVAVEDIVA